MKQETVRTHKTATVPAQSTGNNGSGNDLKDWNRMKGRNKRNKIKLGILLLGLFVVFFVLSALFHSADVELTTRVDERSGSDLVEDASATGRTGTLQFSRSTPFSRTVEIFVEGTAEENVQTKASGTVRVTNTGNTAQRFRSTTRFETPDGRVYRAPRSIPIPANGTVDVEIVADIPGEEYNSDSGLTFTLPGLEGTALFDQITATQSTPIEGGFSGILVAASEEDIEAGKNTLRRELTETLRNELQNRLPAGLIVTTDMTDISEPTFQEVPNEEKGGIDLKATADIAAVTFNKSDFDNFFAAKLINDYTPGQNIEIQNINDFKLEIDTQDFDVRTGEEFRFTLTEQDGSTAPLQFVWSVDEDEIKRALAGRSVSRISTSTIEALSGVETIDVTITPPWKRTLPDNIKKIDITVNN